MSGEVSTSSKYLQLSTVLYHMMGIATYIYNICMGHSQKPHFWFPFYIINDFAFFTRGGRKYWLDCFLFSFLYHRGGTQVLRTTHLDILYIIYNAIN